MVAVKRELGLLREAKLAFRISRGGDSEVKSWVGLVTCCVLKLILSVDETLMGVKMDYATAISGHMDVFMGGCVCFSTDDEEEEEGKRKFRQRWASGTLSATGGNHSLRTLTRNGLTRI